MFKTVEDGQRFLAPGNVRADGLSGEGGVAPDAENIIAHLKGQSQVVTERAQVLTLVAGGSGDEFFTIDFTTMDISTKPGYAKFDVNCTSGIFEAEIGSGWIDDPNGFDPKWWRLIIRHNCWRFTSDPEGCPKGRIIDGEENVTGSFILDAA